MEGEIYENDYNEPPETVNIDQLKTVELKENVYKFFKNVVKKHQKKGQNFNIDFDNVIEHLLKELVDKDEKKVSKTLKELIEVIFWKCKVANNDDLRDLQKLVEISRAHDDLAKMKVISSSAKELLKLRQLNPELTDAILGSHNTDSQRTSRDSGFAEIEEAGIKESHPLWFVEKNWKEWEKAEAQKFEPSAHEDTEEEVKEDVKKYDENEYTYENDIDENGFGNDPKARPTSLPEDAHILHHLQMRGKSVGVQVKLCCQIVSPASETAAVMSLAATQAAEVARRRGAQRAQSAQDGAHCYANFKL